MTLSFLLLASAEPETNPLVQMQQQFGVDGPRLLAQSIAFLVVALCLRKFAYLPIQKVLENRRQKLADDYANSEKIKEQISAAESLCKEMVHKANHQAELIIKQAHEAADIATARRTQEAVREVEQMLLNGREALRSDRTRMEAELRREIVRLVADATQRVTGKILTPADHERLNQETIEQVSRN